jgi:16S rRNA (guanine527-N7)-methyltransferase
VTAPSQDALLAILRESQDLGFLGARPVAEVLDHARAFVTPLAELSAGSRVIDLGAGGGVPGLVIAYDRPDLEVHLLDRRTKRTDFLERVVRRLGWADRVRVLPRDVRALLAEAPPPFAAAVARGFGPPDVTLRAAAQLVAPGGLIVISEPPRGDRWAPTLLEEIGVVRVRDDDRDGGDDRAAGAPAGSRVVVFRIG